MSIESTGYFSGLFSFVSCGLCKPKKQIIIQTSDVENPTESTLLRTIKAQSNDVLKVYENTYSNTTDLLPLCLKENRAWLWLTQDTEKEPAVWKKATVLSTFGVLTLFLPAINFAFPGAKNNVGFVLATMGIATAFQASGKGELRGWSNLSKYGMLLSTSGVGAFLEYFVFHKMDPTGNSWYNQLLWTYLPAGLLIKVFALDIKKWIKPKSVDESDDEQEGSKPLSKDQIKFEVTQVIRHLISLEILEQTKRIDQVIAKTLYKKDASAPLTKDEEKALKKTLKGFYQSEVSQLEKNDWKKLGECVTEILNGKKSTNDDKKVDVVNNEKAKIESYVTKIFKGEVLQKTECKRVLENFIKAKSEQIKPTPNEEATNRLYKKLFEKLHEDSEFLELLKEEFDLVSKK